MYTLYYIFLLEYYYITYQETHYILETISSSQLSIFKDSIFCIFLKLLVIYILVYHMYYKYVYVK